jgi:hypothetical protein
MNDAARYRQKAAECVEASQQANDERKRANLIAMAQTWALLADQADRISRTDLVYETPASNRAGRHIQ